MKQPKICLFCKKPLHKKDRRNNYCNRECFRLSRIGHEVSKETREKLRQINLGKKHSEETKHKLSFKNKGKKAWNKGKRNYQIAGDKNVGWMGKKAKYSAKHKFISRTKGRAEKCVDCGITREETRIEWSNVDHKYSRYLSDYIARCVSCHKKYDKRFL